MNSQFLLLLVIAFAGLLFYSAWRAHVWRSYPALIRPWVYALSLAVYCSSWTFFGAVGTAVSNGWDYLAIYLGPALMFWIGWPFIRRLLVMGARHKVTSIADYIGSRYGKYPLLAAAVTLVAIVASLPYIALQLKAVTQAWSIVGTAPETPGSGASSLVTTLILAGFAVAFGTRIVGGSNRNPGLVMAVALESIVKLVAFLAVGLLALMVLLSDFPGGSPTAIAALWPQPGLPRASFITPLLLSMAATVALPRQFHVMVVEAHDRRDLRRARWFFPLYLMIFSLLILPIAAAGQHFLGHSGISPDTFVLSLPLYLNQPLVAAAAFLGGVSAATGMILVASVSLAIMVCNEILVPLWLRLGRVKGTAASLGFRLRLMRGGSIIVILLLAWLLEQSLGSHRGLASLGLIAFAASAQLVPALVASLYWRRGHRLGVLGGISAGMLLWFYCLLLPAIVGDGHPLMQAGPRGIAWLAPDNLLGTGGLMGPLSHGVFWSLAVNVALFLLISALARMNALDWRQATSFTQYRRRYQFRENDMRPSSIQVRQLQFLAEPLLGNLRSQQLWNTCEQRIRHRLLPTDAAPQFVVNEVEKSLTATIGAISAARAIDLLKSRKPLQIEDFVSLVGSTSRQMKFGQELLQTTFETIPQGISVVDEKQRLSAWNQQYEQLFDYPPRLLYAGRPIEDIYRFNAERGLLGEDSDDVEALVRQRLDSLKSGRDYRIERKLPSGRVVEIHGTPLPNGGYVTTFTEITAYRQLLDQLAEHQRTLEQRIAERTQELSGANESLRRENELRARIERELKRVYDSKSRFLAATSHDLLQPINAARLFLSSLREKQKRYGPGPGDSDIANLDSALETTEQLIESLREFARLDSGKMTPKREHFAVADLLRELHDEFSPQADRQQLQLHLANSRLWVYTDRLMLRRMVQNLLSNALRYTRSGRVLLGCRRRGEQLLIEVWDTGPGIPEQHHNRIFEEFSRLGEQRNRPSDKGLGLGLSITRQLARLLGHELSFDSSPGRGSVFRIAVPVGEPGTQEPARETTAPFAGAGHILCVDNEPAITAGLRSLLETWGYRVTTAASLGESIRLWDDDAPPIIILADFHLDNDETGVDLVEALRVHWQRQIPGVVISADDSEPVRHLCRRKGLGFLAKPVHPAGLRSLIRQMSV